MLNPIMSLAQAVKGGRNPKQMIRQMAMQNPRVAQFEQMTNGKSEGELRSMAENMASERGIDLNELAQQLGVRIPR